MHAEDIARADRMDVTLPYVKPGEHAIFHPGRRDLSYWPVEEHVVRMHDARAAADRFSLEKNGFVLLTRPTAVKNFYDPAQVHAVYYPEIEALVKEITGASRVLVFGEIARSDAPGTPDSLLPARGAHVDYGAQTVRWFAEVEVGAEEAERLLAHRHIQMNLWRPIVTVEKSPLALCDASTVAKDDLNPSEIRGGLNDPNRPTMYGFNLSYNPKHRWWYAPHMRPDEILAFKLFDSDPSRVQWTGHTAFDDPTSPPDAAPRQSMEIRTIAIFED